MSDVLELPWDEPIGPPRRGLVDSYEAVHQGDALLLLRDRDPPPPELAQDLAPQPRDLEILRALWRYRFLLTSQIAREWWPGKSLYAAQRRLLRMTAAGWVERFRPRLSKGKHEWVYQLARQGFELCKVYWHASGPFISSEAKWRPRHVSDYRVVQHDLQLNAWAIAYRRLAACVADWLGPEESRLEVPTRYEDRRFRPLELREAQGRVPGNALIDGLRLERFRPVMPDATLRLWFEDPERDYELLVELDRTRRPVKNLDKLRRYDALLAGWWWLAERYRDAEEAPAVVFVCTDEQQALSLMAAADREVTGAHLRPGDPPERWYFPLRERMLFVAERDVHDGDGRAWRLPTRPPGRGRGEFYVREGRLPGTGDGHR